MVDVKTLYHPKFEPPEPWLRAMLLFYDTVHSIVPDGAGYQPSPWIAELNEHADEPFVPLVPTRKDLSYDWNGFHALTSVLDKLPREDGPKAFGQARFDTVGGVPRLDLGNGVQVHHEKMGDVLINELEGRGLARRRADSDWVEMDRRVGDLVLSMLADRMARNRPGGIYTCSDRETSFAVAAASGLRRGEQWRREATLASAILQAEIPGDIAEMPLVDYLDLRKRYEERRDVFRLAMRDLETLYFVHSFEEPGEFKQRRRLQDG